MSNDLENIGVAMLSSKNTVAMAPYLAIVLFAMLAATYAFPQTDDYCLFGKLKNNFGWNPFVATADMYHVWSGRFSAMFFIEASGWLTHVLPLPLQMTYAAILIALVGALLWAAYLAFSIVAPSMALAAVATVAIIGTMPWKLEGVMWLTGAAVYTAPFVAIMLLVALIEREKTAGAATIVLVAISVGFNEFVGLAVGVFLAVRFFLNRQDWRPHAILGVVYVLAFGVSVLAPGNFVRSAEVSAPHDLVAALGMSADSFLMYLANHVAPNWFMFACLLIAAFAATWGAKAIPFHRAMPAIVAFLSAFPINLIGLPFLMGEPIPGRTLNQAHGFLILGMLLVAAWLGAYVSSRTKWAVPPLVGPGVVFATGLVCLGNPLIGEYTRTITTYAGTWRAEQTARHVMLSKGTGPVAVPAFSPEPGWPPVLRGADISADATYWVNSCLGSYYGRAVTLEAADSGKAYKP